MKTIFYIIAILMVIAGNTFAQNNNADTALNSSAKIKEIKSTLYMPENEQQLETIADFLQKCNLKYGWGYAQIFPKHVAWFFDHSRLIKGRRIKKKWLVYERTADDSLRKSVIYNNIDYVTYRGIPYIKLEEEVPAVIQPELAEPTIIPQPDPVVVTPNPTPVVPNPSPVVPVQKFKKDSMTGIDNSNNMGGVNLTVIGSHNVININKDEKLPYAENEGKGYVQKKNGIWTTLAGAAAGTWLALRLTKGFQANPLYYGQYGNGYGVYNSNGAFNNLYGFWSSSGNHTYGGNGPW